MQLSVGQLAETVTITAETPLVDLTSKEIGGNVTNREVTMLPSINGNFVGVVALLPGVISNVSTESFGSDAISANGLDSRNNNFMLDGANNNDDVIGQRAGSQARTPLEAVAEFQVVTNQYDAEFGRTTGAIINAISKQGTNAFHGVAAGLWQDASLTQKDFFVKQNGLNKPETQLQTYRANIGGPVVRDKAHFFFNLERVMIDRANTITIPARPEFNTSPVTQDRVWNTLARFDHQLNVNHSWAVRWLRESSPQLNQIVPVMLTVPVVVTLPVTANASREETRRRPDHRRHAELGARRQPPQHAARELHPGGRGVRQREFQRQRAGPGGAASAAELPDVRRSAERRGAGTRERCLSDRRHDVVVHHGTWRQPRSQVRRAVPIRRGAIDRRRTTPMARSRSGPTHHSMPPIRAPTPSGCRFGCPAR